MPKTLCRSDKPLFLNIFPQWKGRQPLRFYLLENLLEARRGCGFPTNGAGPDEDVNVFLAGLLTRFLQGDHNGQIVAAAGSVMEPPDPGLDRRGRAEFYLANANHRLLYLGLMNRGDGLRRRRIPFGRSEDETRRLDTGVGKSCYRLAANLLEDRRLVTDGLVEVLGKLADHFEDYVHVLAALATRKLGLGAHLSENDLADLLEDKGTDLPERYPQRILPPDHPDMDLLLDLILQYRKNPGEDLERKLRAVARRAGTDVARILGPDPF